MSGPHALFFVYVWPEPRSSAAGVRTRALVEALQNAGWEVCAASPSHASPHSEELNRLGVSTLTCDPNLGEATERSLGALAPELVVYDRFVMEEQFGWRARALWPAALHVVDTQDLHSLRRGRERLARRGAPAAEILRPSAEDLGDDLLRELASLYRSDAALVVSSFEEKLLSKEFGVPASRLGHLPFPALLEPSPRPFTEREGFCFLGNFRHPPNLDSVRWLAGELWPEVRKLLPSAKLHLYGAYPPAEVSRFRGENGIYAHGPVADHRRALENHRVLLAPLRFGAGIKGKVLEAWSTGTPVVGTELTFEGMEGPGRRASRHEEFAALAAQLHEEESAWRSEQERGLDSVRENYAAGPLAFRFLTLIGSWRERLAPSRQANLTGQMLRHQQSNATKYFSRWIEAKNAGRSASGANAP